MSQKLFSHLSENQQIEIASALADCFWQQRKQLGYSGFLNSALAQEFLSPPSSIVIDDWRRLANLVNISLAIKKVTSNH